MQTRRVLTAWTLATVMFLTLAGLAAAHGPGMGGDLPHGDPGMGMTTGGPLPVGHDADHTGNPGQHLSDQDHLYCDQTGHYLSYGFKTFWEHNGGVSVFGYPLTEEFSQQGRTMQILERQRFEYHPELAGTPYAVELGRLGYEEAQHRGLLGTTAFAPLPATTSSDASTTFFPQTGHGISNGFRAYWMAHGLDLETGSTAFQRSVALFGYPISQEFTDPTTGMTVQYFERAVFEYHPNNAAPYQVLLQRLGADALAHE